MFPASLVLYGIFFLSSAAYCYRTNESNITSREKLARDKIIGTLISFAALIWCAKHGLAIFPGEPVRVYFIPAAFFFAWASYFLLDFLAARGLGALMILAAHYHLHNSFAWDSPLRPFFSVLCFIIGTCGIFICGKPCLLRDFFRAIAQNQSKRKAYVIFLSGASIVFISYGIYHFFNPPR
jgi:hypothetical protein